MADSWGGMMLKRWHLKTVKVQFSTSQYASGGRMCLESARSLAGDVVSNQARPRLYLGLDLRVNSRPAIGAALSEWGNGGSLISRHQMLFSPDIGTHVPMPSADS